MGGDASADLDEPIVGINVTPLVDVVLLLLVVLMVSAPLLASQVLPIDLPKAASGNEQTVVLAIELGADGRTAINQKLIASDEEARAVVRAAHAGDPSVRAVIQADGAVPHSRVVGVMDMLRGERIGKIAFAVVEPNRAEGTGSP